MKTALGSVTLLLAGASLALAQPPTPNAWEFLAPAVPRQAPPNAFSQDTAAPVMPGAPVTAALPAPQPMPRSTTADAVNMPAPLAPALTSPAPLSPDMMSPAVPQVQQPAETGQQPPQDQGQAPAQPPAQPPAAGQGQAPAAPATQQATQNGQAATTGPTAADLKDTHVGPGYQIWASADYLHWWTRSGPVPVPIATLDSTTSVLVGNSSLDYGGRSGAQAWVGTWLDERHVFGVEFGGFWLEDKTASSSASSATIALGQPFFNVATGSGDAFLLGPPAAVSVSSHSEFWGLELNFVRNLMDCCYFSADLLFGARYLDLDEDLNIARTSVAPAPFTLAGMPEPAGAGLAVSDRFMARNQFYAGQIGGRAEWHRGGLFFNVTGKVALGPNHETVNVLGSSTATAPGAPSVTVPGGFLALAGTNIGRQKTDWFSVAPQVGVQLGYHVTQNIRAHVGYDFLYINSVVRPGEQIALRVNPSFVPTSPAFGTGSRQLAEPGPFLRQDDFWAHGISAGLTIEY
jgi:hypothetical protein